MAKPTGPGLAYTTREDGRVRGTYDGRYVVIGVPDVTDGDDIVRRLRERFANPLECHPIPKDGLPPLP